MSFSPRALVYLHGFKSSPNSAKAQDIKAYISEYHPDIEFICPNIPDTPDAAIPFLTHFMELMRDKDCALIGSSLGGFYAIWLAETFNCPAILVNPAIAPQHYWQKNIGLHQNPYSGVQFAITEKQLGYLMYIEQQVIVSERYCVLLQMGDEVLNAVEACEKFFLSHCIIECGGNHQFVGFKRYLPHLFSWLHWE